MDNGSVVYAIHEPVRYDKRKNCMVKLNLDMAESFGSLRVVFPGEDRPPPIEVAAQKLRESMSAFRACDRLLLVGDMDLVAFAAVLAAKASNGHLVLLKWHSRERRYYEVEAPEGLFT